MTSWNWLSSQFVLPVLSESLTESLLLGLTSWPSTVAWQNHCPMWLGNVKCCKLKDAVNSHWLPVIRVVRLIWREMSVTFRTFNVSLSVLVKNHNSLALFPTESVAFSLQSRLSSLVRSILHEIVDGGCVT